MDEKKSTVKSLDREIERERLKLSRDTEKRAELNKEIAKTSKRIKELEKLRVTVLQDEFHNKIYRQYIKKGVVTEDDILKWLDERKAQEQVVPEPPQVKVTVNPPVEVLNE